MARSPCSRSPSLDAVKSADRRLQPTARPPTRFSLFTELRRSAVNFVCRSGAKHLFSVRLADVGDAARIAEEGLRRFRAGDSYASVRAWVDIEKSTARRKKSAARRLLTAPPASRISLYRELRRGATNFECRAGAEHLFAVRLPDVADAHRIAAEGQRRLRAGDSYASVRAWVASEKSAARRPTALL